jgi:hypothetical protein
LQVPAKIFVDLRHNHFAVSTATGALSYSATLPDFENQRPSRHPNATFGEIRCRIATASV